MTRQHKANEATYPFLEHDELQQQERAVAESVNEFSPEVAISKHRLPVARSDLQTCAWQRKELD